MLLIITFFQVEGPPGLAGPAVGNHHQVFVVTSHHVSVVTLDAPWLYTEFSWFQGPPGGQGHVGPRGFKGRRVSLMCFSKIQLMLMLTELNIVTVNVKMYCVS